MQSTILSLVLTFGIMYFVSGQIKIPTTVCSFAGTDSKIIPNTVTPNDIPALCQAVCYGFYYMDDGMEAISDTDTKAIEALRAENKTVYVRVTFSAQPNWNGLLNSMTETGPENLFTKHITRLVTRLKDLGIAGVFLDKLHLFKATDIKPDYATQLNLFIKNLKADLPGLKVGLVVNGSESHLFGNEELFNFNTCNPGVDIYVIDMLPTVLTCDDAAAIYGRLPMDFLQKVTVAVSRSGMAKEKLMINLVDEVTAMEKNTSKTLGKNYGDFCQARKEGIQWSPFLWCKDTIKMFCEQAEFARVNYAGMMLSYLDYDDFYNVCECSKFIVAKIFLNAWDKKEIPPCQYIAD